MRGDLSESISREGRNHGLYCGRCPKLVFLFGYGLILSASGLKMNWTDISYISYRHHHKEEGKKFTGEEALLEYSERIPGPEMNTVDKIVMQLK